uniref:aminopeptidase RNPEPL1 isoform X2 n=1 Tax=Gasterosteus aculeatus aculeatus TaxID=481459 RepID=UPI001A97ECF5|nr:aminopeptidase RNPEPL1 isoform X2 [Gasterosteus aculeatus aculeatus]
MAELHQTPTSLCCCRKPLLASGPRCDGDSRPLAAPGPGTPRGPLVDVASASNFRSFRLRHLHLDLRLNFAVKEMSGWLVLDLVPAQKGVTSLVLDSHPSLLIHSIDCKDPGAGQEEPISLTYRVDPFTDYGSSLNISLPPAAVKPGRLIQITVRYTTTDGPAIWWLDSELTCGQSRPLVFTQGHSVCNRSFFPCFDTPAVKSTYTATVRVPEGVTVLMSASLSSYSTPDRVFQFSMEFPVPSYLVALVAGELQHVDVGPRSRVWAEPCLLSCAVKKLGGSVERWLGVAEELFGPYLWGRCDIVFLPPSFPIVAMENPCLTFIIASILESSEFLLIDVVHEIAHGWFGNAVTNATWEEMWLSEGLATYAQRRITTEAYGKSTTSTTLSTTYAQRRITTEAYGKSTTSTTLSTTYAQRRITTEAYGKSTTSTTLSTTYAQRRITTEAYGKSTTSTTLSTTYAQRRITTEAYGKSTTSTTLSTTYAQRRITTEAYGKSTTSTTLSTTYAQRRITTEAYGKSTTSTTLSTTYAQRRITTEAYGEAFTCLETAVRLDALHKQLRLLGDNNPVSKLQVKFEPGVNPSSLMNLFTYEKGFCFVSYLSELSGDVRRFDCFLRDYISEFKFQSVVAQDLIDYFLQYFPQLMDVSHREGLEFERWLNGSGPPLFEPDLSAAGALTQPVQDLCDLWRGCQSPDPQALVSFDLSAWSTFQIVLFLDRMLDQTPLPRDVMTRLSACYASVFDGLNAEVQIRWLQMVVRNSFHPELPRVRAFLHKHTSRMYTVPLYDDLVAGVMKCVAVEVFNQTQRRLHPNLRRTLQQILFQTSSASTNQNVPILSAVPPSASSSPFSQQVATAASAGTTAAIALRDVNVSA